MTGGKNNPQTKQTRERRVSVRAIRRQEIDISKLARALIALAQVEAEAQAEHEAKKRATDEVADD